jgi:hypothetical protein
MSEADLGPTEFLCHVFPQWQNVHNRTHSTRIPLFTSLKRKPQAKGVKTFPSVSSVGEKEVSELTVLTTQCLNVHENAIYHSNCEVREKNIRE